MDFLKKWEPKKEFSKTNGPLRPQLEEAIKIIAQQLQRLDMKYNRIKAYDQALFERIIYYYRSQDMTRAKIYANELYEVRKLAKIIMTTRLALEQISVRLSTVREYGDVAVNVAPAIQAINKIYGGVAQIVPETDGSMLKLNDLLEGVMVEAGQCTGLSMNTGITSEDGMNILNEASRIAEAELSKTLPNVPNLERRKESLGF